MVRISFDPAKRALTLANRGLDFAEARAVFEGLHATQRDERRDYGEVRYVTGGFLAGRLVVMVWTPRGGTRRVISMSYAHEREAETWRRRMAGP